MDKFVKLMAITPFGCRPTKKLRAQELVPQRDADESGGAVSFNELAPQLD
jgi:hypothetical protein